MLDGVMNFTARLRCRGQPNVNSPEHSFVAKLGLWPAILGQPIFKPLKELFGPR